MPPSAAKWVHFVPATKSSASAMVTYTMLVPRSGWAITNSVGRRARSMIREVVSRSPRRRSRSMMKADRASISSTLPSSEGWKRKNESSIQRRDPRVAPATPSTSKIKPSMVA